MATLNANPIIQNIVTKRKEKTNQWQKTINDKKKKEEKTQPNEEITKRHENIGNACYYFVLNCNFFCVCLFVCF